MIFAVGRLLAARPWCVGAAVATSATVTTPYRGGRVGRVSLVGPWGRIEGKNEPLAGPKPMFSASTFMQREIPTSPGNVSVESARKSGTDLCKWGCGPGAQEEMV